MGVSICSVSFALLTSICSIACAILNKIGTNVRANELLIGLSIITGKNSGFKFFFFSHNFLIFIWFYLNRFDNNFDILVVPLQRRSHSSHRVLRLLVLVLGGRLGWLLSNLDFVYSQSNQSPIHVHVAQLRWSIVEKFKLVDLKRDNYN